MTHKAYILNVSPRYLAVYPTTAGPKMKPENPKVVKLDTVNEIGSVVILIAWRITIAIKLAVNKPNKTSAGIIKYRFAVNILRKSMVAPNTDR